MSIPYDTLHELAELFKPKLPIKSTSTWVAVLLHTKLNIKEIQEERDFMWVKCHDRITLRTIKHTYFSRHPLDDFKLKHRHEYPRLTRTVGLLRKREKTDGNVIVLRALEPEDARYEDQVRKDSALTREIRETAPGGSGSEKVVEGDTAADEDDLIVVSENIQKKQGKSKASVKKIKSRARAKSTESEDSPGEVEVKKEHKKNTEREDSRGEVEVKKEHKKGKQRQVSESSDEEIELTASRSPTVIEETSPEDMQEDSEIGDNQAQHSRSNTHSSPVSKSPSPTMTEFATNQFLAEQANDPSQQLLSEQAAHYTSPAFASLNPSNRHTSPSTLPAYSTTNFDEQMDLDISMYESPSAGLLARINALPEPYASRVTQTNYHTCEVPSCRKELHLQPWTVFGPRHGALCTQCSGVRLAGTDPEGLILLQEQVKAEFERKESLNRQGGQHDMDDDAPIMNTAFPYSFSALNNEEDDDNFETSSSVEPSRVTTTDIFPSPSTARHLARASAFLDDSIPEDPNYAEDGFDAYFNDDDHQDHRTRTPALLASTSQHAMLGSEERISSTELGGDSESEGNEDHAYAEENMQVEQEAHGEYEGVSGDEEDDD